MKKPVPQNEKIKKESCAWYCNLNRKQTTFFTGARNVVNLRPTGSFKFVLPARITRDLLVAALINIVWAH